jgi:hypothetical protein
VARVSWGPSINRGAKPRLVVICEDVQQLKRTPFISQLYPILCQSFDVKTVSRLRFKLWPVRFGADELVLSLLRQRSWKQMLPALARATERSGIVFYDQDPWEAYHQNASSPGIYAKVNGALKVKRFLVTSRWWANYMRDRDGLPMGFVRMGARPEICEVGPSYDQRPIEVGFQGKLHSHRKAFFDRMKDLKVDVVFRPSKPYEQFLKELHDIRIYLHDERCGLFLDDGKPLAQWLWVKESEAAARGCFVIRDYEEESLAYGMDELPTVMPFRQEADVPSIIETIRSMSESERLERMKTSVETIRQRDDWQTVVSALKEIR